jgi:hypothetical protein
MAGRGSSEVTSPTRVTRSGIALVHEGELIVPAAGAEADLEAGTDARGPVIYSFPVEVEVRTVLVEPDVDAIARHALSRLVEGLRSR